MALTDAWNRRFVDLMNEVDGICAVVLGDNIFDMQSKDRKKSQAQGWLVSALNLVRAASPDPASAYRMVAERVVGTGVHGEYARQVRDLAHILRALKADVDAGLLQSAALEATLIGFTDLIGHAVELLAHNRVDVAGVIAGVAFEDTLRRLGVERGVEDGLSVENLIARFQNDGTLSGLDAKHARAAAGLRTSATHARWTEFNTHHVDACIRFTRELLVKMSP